VTPAPRDRLIVALDLPSVAEADTMVDRLGDAVTFYKIGYQLVFAGGLPLAQALIAAGKRVFLDMKLHDIANSVAGGVDSVARMGVTFLTIHAYPQTMQAAVAAKAVAAKAVAAKAGSGLRLLGVTVLTSYDDIDLSESGYAMGVDDLVAKRAVQAHEAGLDGLVCSAEEASALRLMVGDMVLVTPGIRPAGIASGDQKRVTTPTQAIAAGADYLVVGRPILACPDPRQMADRIVAEIAAAAST
jgi:orotidine-5'-phosphate decarboxylase